MAEQVVHIESLRWELDAPTLQAAKDWQEEISRFSQQGIAGIIRDSLQDHPTGEELVIPRIEIQLPAVKHPDEIAALFETAWKEAIAEQLIAHKLHKKGIRHHHEAIEQTMLRQLLHFLLTGNLPWYSDASLFNDRAVLFGLLKEQSPAELKRLLEMITQEPVAVKRWINLFDEAELITVMRLAGAYHTDMALLKNTINKLFTGWLPGWEHHTYRKYILVTALMIQLKQQVYPVAPGLITGWWQSVKRENYFSAAETNTIGLAANAAMLRFKDQPAGNELAEDIIVRVIAGIELERAVTKTFLTKEQLAEEETLIPEQALTKEEKGYWFVENAGIILLYPFLKGWFRESGLTDEQNTFPDPESRMKGCRVLQAVAAGKSDFMEYHLVLNKVLCGYALDMPVYGESTELEKTVTLANERLAVVIAQWEKIRNTSVEGFRNSFLLRNGKLTEEEDHYLLRVERKGWDVLLDSYPYPKSIIKLPWMHKPLYTEW